jgi:hypothetical protein
MLVAAAAAGLAGFGAAQQADASLIIDIRATTLNGAALPAGSTAKSVAAGPGDVVGIEVHAVVSGANGVNDETFQLISGSYFSQGGLLGNLGGQSLVSPFNGSGSQAGSQQDFDSDGDLDIGSIPNGARPQTNSFYLLPRAPGQVDGTTVDANSEDMLLARMNFTVTGGNGGSNIDFVRRQFANGTNDFATATWFEDGVQHSGTSPYSTSPLAVGGVVPEPTSAALAGIAALGLLARRRNKNA